MPEVKYLQAHMVMEGRPPQVVPGAGLLILQLEGRWKQVIQQAHMALEGIQEFPP